MSMSVWDIHTGLKFNMLGLGGHVYCIPVLTTGCLALYIDAVTVILGVWMSRVMSIL